MFHSSLSYFIILLCIAHHISSDDTFFLYKDDTEKYAGQECKTSAVQTNLRDGTCEKLSDCTHAEGNVYQKDLCSFENNVPLYCCPYAVSKTKYKRVTGLRLIDQICEFYHPRYRPSDAFFVGGNITLIDTQPHMAAIGWKNSNGGIDWKCGGSVITTNFIITAAHCARNGEKAPDIARTGDLNLLVEEKNLHPQDHEIIQIFVRPSYNQNSMYHDIALMKIAPDFKISIVRRPACIWYNYEIPDSNLLGMGYGTTSFSGPQSNQLFEGYLQLQPHEQCVKNVPISPDTPNGIIKQQLCAQDPKHATDTCQGDSGGPLLFTRIVGNTVRRMIVGITSFGQYCAGSVPGVYTRVSEYLEWIEQVLLSDFHYINIDKELG